jgi:DUF4097 and DUF4098 domain-containing protein YvlB
MRVRVLKIKSHALAFVCVFACALVCLMRVATVRAAGVQEREAAQQSVAAAESVTVVLCVESGDVTVRGWERKEVRARAVGAARVELRRGGAEPSPAERVEVLTVGAGESSAGGCNHTGGNVSLDVPRGSFVQVKSYSGRITVSDVAGARVETLSGDIALRGVTKSVEATTANGVITLRSSKGRAHLRTISGMIEASDVGTNEAGDDFTANTTSGEIILTRISHTQVEASTTVGAIELTGALARGGTYALRSQSGDVTVTLPEDSSFLLTAKVYSAGEIVTDFPIRQLPKKSPGGENGIVSSGQLTGVYGKSDSPDATLSLTSFNGTVRLRKANANR